MRKTFAIAAYAILVPVALLVVPCALAESYPTMAPLEQYRMPQEAEIALARSAAPASIAEKATVMVLGRQGYTTAATGTDGFLCLVERGWGAATDAPDFWNPKVRAPHCFNPAAARTFLPIYMLKTKLVLVGKSRAEILQTTDAAFAHHRLPALAPGAMVYMMSKQQYLNDEGKSWHPHVMVYVAGSVAASWGANLPGSPVIAADDPQERVTIFMIVVHHWSDGTPAP